MSKHSRRSDRVRRARRLGGAASALAVVAFVVLAVLGLAGVDLLPGGRGSTPTADTTLAGSTPTATPTGSPSPPGASTGAPSPAASGPASGPAGDPAASSTASTGAATPSAGASRAPRQRVLRAGPPLTLIPQPVVSSFRIASYNVLGSQHQGNGPGRAATAARMMADRGIDLAGLQEVQDDQRAAILGALPGYAVWPGDALGNQGYRHQILYRTDRFEIVEGGSVPYVFDSQNVPLPYALMRDKESGGEFYFIDAHNSARGLQGQRDQATGIEAALVNRLKATGLPVLMSIDSNEHTEWFCRMAGSAGVVSANGGYYSGGCRLPSGPLRIDWIVGAAVGDDAAVDFSDYVQDISPQRMGISDHYLIYADVAVTSPPPQDGPGPSAGASSSPSASPSAG